MRMVGRSCLMLAACLIAAAPGCVQQTRTYTLGGRPYTSRAEAEEALRRSLAECLASVQPLPRAVGGRLLAVLPTKEYVSRHFIWTVGSRSALSQDQLDYIATAAKANVDAYPRYLERFNLFESVEVVETGVSPSWVPPAYAGGAYDWAFFFSEDGEYFILERHSDGKRWSIYPTPGAFGPATVNVINDRFLAIVAPNYDKASASLGGAILVACDLRAVSVTDGSVAAGASADCSYPNLDKMARTLASRLKDGFPARGESVAVVTLRDRGGSAQTRHIVDEVADKTSRALVDTGWFQVKERIDLRAVLDERDLETAGLVTNPEVRRKLAGVKYIIIGGVSVSTVPPK